MTTISQNKVLGTEFIQKADERYHALLNSASMKDELISIQENRTKLFPARYAIDKETTELFRAMCILSQCNSSSKLITSHRPVIGKAIVFLKKSAWKLIEPQIKHIFDGVSDCFSSLIQSHASLLNKIKELEIRQEEKR